MNEKKPLVSIVIPVYNGSNFLKQAIDCAVNQTYENKEILVINDGSSDDGATEQIALSYGDKIKYIYKENGGVSSALNLGIKNMKGEYFSWLSHDDLYKPEKIEKEIEALKQYNINDALVYCGVDLIDKDSNKIRSLAKPKHLRVGVNEWHEALDVMFKQGSYNGCALLIPKKALDVSSDFDESLRYAQDAKMWANIFLNGFKLVYIDASLCCNRVHSGQLTQKGRSLFYIDTKKISDELIPKIISTGEYAKKLMYSYAYHNATLGNKAVVKTCKSMAKQYKLLSASKRIKVTMAGAYGKIRPLIRRIYYRIFRRIKTK
ncbi:MAG: glycosyltransferase [Clostridia bacterium]|nr:glycosyltransferase [Clostridia bacterium]